MYQYIWDKETHGFLLVPIMGEAFFPLRPVFYEELDMLGFDKHWHYPRVSQPLLWADGTRRYHMDGELVAALRGGGLFTDPDLNIIEDELYLQPVDVEEMIIRNRSIMHGLEQTAIATIYEAWRKHKNKDAIYVAFSGGKDSIVLLDLVYRALGVKDFAVIFGDTGMELPDTLDSIKETGKRYPGMDIYTAESVLKPEESWDIFGPPARRQRWCCSVHKSAPSILKLRDIYEKPVKSILVFDGVRKDESAMRADYEEETRSAKHAAQDNVRPLLEWNSAEIFNYIFSHNLVMNNVYRKGFTRAGCIICPMSFGWRDFMTRKWYPSLVEPYIKEIEHYAASAAKNQSDIKGYIEEGGWMARVGGKHIANARRLVTDSLEDGVLLFRIECKRERFFEWAKVLPGLEIRSAESASVTFPNGVRYEISIQDTDTGLLVSYSPIINQYNERTELKYLRMLANKAAYCVGCQVCEAECIHGALHITANRVAVDPNLCKHCFSCFTFDKGCLVAKSLYISKDGDKVKSYDKYGTFGMEPKFIERVFADKLDLLGPKQRPSIKTWMREAGMSEEDGLSLFGKLAQQLGLEDESIWALVWVNLAYGSPIINWYVNEIEEGVSYTKPELCNRLTDGGKPRTRKNAIDALINTLKNPIVSDTLGQGNLQKSSRHTMVRRTTWSTPEPLVVLYSLYRLAEAEGKRYSFTLNQLICESFEEGISPATLFGLPRDVVESLLRGLAINHPSFISVELTLGLDNINLSADKTSYDALILLQQ